MFCAATGRGQAAGAVASVCIGGGQSKHSVHVALKPLSLCFVQQQDEGKQREQLPLFAAKRLPSLADRQQPGLLSATPDPRAASDPRSVHMADEDPGSVKLLHGDMGAASLPSRGGGFSAFAQAATSALRRSPNDNVSVGGSSIYW